MENKDVNSFALFAAMDKESDFILSKVTDKTLTPKGYVKGKLFGKTFYFVKTGIGSLSSAFAATKFLSLNKPDLVINVGCVGAHFVKGDYDDLIVVNAFLGQSDFLSEGLDRISTDKAYTQKLISCFDQTVYFGDIASADVWRGADQIPDFVKEYGTLGEDMEGYAQIYCANNFSVPFISVKFISNNELAGKNYLCNGFCACQQKIFNALEKFFN